MSLGISGYGGPSTALSLEEAQCLESDEDLVDLESRAGVPSERECHVRSRVLLRGRDAQADALAVARGAGLNLRSLRLSRKPPC